MIDRATIDKIIDTAEIVDVVGDFVSLKRRGANYIACCPFHNEKTPSFSVSPSKGIYKCFGCGKAGNAVGFIMEHEQMTYVEALKYLGRKYGIEVKEEEETAEDIADKQRRESLLVVSEFAKDYFINTLFNTQVGKAIGLSYFKEARGFSDETIRKFCLGFAPDSQQFNRSNNNDTTSLAETAAKNGYKREFLTATGLCVERDNGKLVDRFYDRVMFPIHSISGRVIAFGGRTLRTDKTIAKYVNSPETEIYNKSQSLYGIYFAKSAISKEQKCFLVEGYADVISFHQSGIENVVASSGTSLTREQVRLIRRFSNRVTVLYDGDAAGIKASIRGIDILIEEGMEVKVVLLPEGEDPDSFARSHNTQELKEFLQEAETDFINFKYELLSKDIKRDPIRKASLIKEIIRTISLIPDQITRSVYIEECATKLEVKQEMLIMEVGKTRRDHIVSGEYEKKREAERIARRKEYEARFGGQQTTINTHPQQTAPQANDIPEYIPEEGDEYIPTEEDYTDSSPENNAAIEIDIVVPILEHSEKELLYYLIRFGDTIIHFEDHQIYGSEQPTKEIKVAEYISAELKSDDLEFQNTILKNVYDLYFILKKEVGTHEKICHYLINNPDQKIAKEVLNFICDNYTISIKEFQKSLIPEENILGIAVPKAILIYKAKYTEYTYQVIQEQLMKAQRENNTELQMELMKQIRILMQVKNQFSKELNRLT